MLTTTSLEKILTAIPSLTIGVLGDLFLDRYLDLDARLTEPSIETGLDAYQVVCVRASPGAAGTVINNLAALGAGRIVPISMIGDDGEGYELLQALRQMPAVDTSQLFSSAQRRTPTYTKPMLVTKGNPPRELNRLDIKNREPLPAEIESKVVRALERNWFAFDALLVLDQVSEADCGVVTPPVRDHLSALAGKDARRTVIADSRERIGLFQYVSLKPNESECRRAVGEIAKLSEAICILATRCERPVFCTRGAAGMLVGSPGESAPIHVPGYPVAGAIDPVGAGDSSSAALACALAAGASLTEAAAFGNLVASITIQQIGTTGTASPAQVRQAFHSTSSS